MQKPCENKPFCKRSYASTAFVISTSTPPLTYMLWSLSSRIFFDVGILQIQLIVISQATDQSPQYGTQAETENSQILKTLIQDQVT